jgi:hypothetical protein
MEYDTPEVDETAEERVVTEILGDCDVFIEGDGPNGPWTYRSLTVRRHGNIINVRDVDGVALEVFHVDELQTEQNHIEPRDPLRGWLEQLNDESLAAL